MNPGDRIPLPERGFTCTPPWPQAIACAGKRLENRPPNVAATVRDYRGLVAISQSKTWNKRREKYAVRDLRERGHFNAQALDDWSDSYEDWIYGWAGKLVLVAELKEVIARPLAQHSLNYSWSWHIPGNAALILGRVWEVEPVEFTGAVGIWYAGQCPICMTVQGWQGRDQKCRKCGANPMSEPGPRSGYCWQRPMLTIMRECEI